MNEHYQLSSLGINTIHKLFSLLRKCIAQYYFTVYNYEKLAYNNKYKTIAIDESLSIHDHNGRQEWVIGMNDVFSKNIRVEFVIHRNKEIIKKLVLLHIGSNNTIITDGWDSYNCLSSSNYRHIIHVHAAMI